LDRPLLHKLAHQIQDWYARHKEIKQFVNAVSIRLGVNKFIVCWWTRHLPAGGGCALFPPHPLRQLAQLAHLAQEHSHARTFHNHGFGVSLGKPVA